MQKQTFSKFKNEKRIFQNSGTKNKVDIKFRDENNSLTNKITHHVPIWKPVKTPKSVFSNCNLLFWRWVRNKTHIMKYIFASNHFWALDLKASF